MASGKVVAFGAIAIACAMATAFFLFFGAQLVYAALTFDGEGSLGHVGMFIAAGLFPLLALFFGGCTLLAWRKIPRPFTAHLRGKRISDGLSRTTRRRLDIQGFEACDSAALAPVARWLRLAFALCALIAGVGTALASPGILLTLVPVAALAAALPVHPFDLIYNLGIRHLTGTGPLPRRGAPSRFACGLGAAWLLPTAWLFSAGYSTAGYILGGALTAVAILVSTTDICIPSLMFRTVFGFPPTRDHG